MSRRISLLRLVALSASVAGAVASQAAFLGTAAVVWTGVPDPQGTQGWNNAQIQVSYLGSNGFHNENYLGFYRWEQTSTNNGNAPAPGPHYQLRGLGGAGDSLNPNDFYTVCGQFKGIQSPVGFGVWDSDSLTAAIKRGGAVAGGDWNNLGTTKNFEEAYSWGDRLHAAGFQLAVWAAIYGDGSTWTGANVTAGGGFGGLLTIGNFTAENQELAKSGDWTTVLGYAKDYYTWAEEDAFKWRSLFLDSGIGNETGQDQYTVDPGPPQGVPEPFSMALGIMGAGAYIRRRIKAKRA